MLKENIKEYDAFVIVDADAVLTENYVEELNNALEYDCDIIQTRKLIKDFLGDKTTRSFICNSSALIYPIIDDLSNTFKSHKNLPLNLCGQGLMIRRQVIEKKKGWHYKSLTEDYELTLYATVHKLTTCYEERAIFYDEQPTTLKASIKQRIRWIRGYFNARVNYLPQLKEKIFDNQMNYGSVYKEIMWLRPILILALAFVIFYLAIIINQIYMLIKSTYDLSSLILGLIVIGITYLVMMFFTIYQLISERKHIKVKNSLKVKIILYNPIFLLTFIYCAIAAIVKKNITWERIEHTKTNIE